MSKLVISILNMSLKAGFLILAVLLLRLLLQKAPKRLTVFLWLLPALRLMIPVSFTSPLSLFPSREPLPGNIMAERDPAVDSGVKALDEWINPIIKERFSPSDGSGYSEMREPDGQGVQKDPAHLPLQILLGYISWVWLAGLFLMLLYAVISSLHLRHRLKESVRFGDAIRMTDRVGTAFILGIFKPVIYLPVILSEEDRPYVLAHERAHLRRGDHLVKPFSFLLLSAYWFQPLVWLGYILFSRDLEAAADEAVLFSMGDAARKPYAAALLNASEKRLTACPLAFGETHVKGRIKQVLNGKKPALWLSIAAVFVIGAAALCFLTDPQESEPAPGTCPEDFALLIRWGVGGTSGYDSSTGKLIKTTDASHPEDYVTAYRLTEEERQQFYQLLVTDLDIFSYPGQYDPFNAPGSDTLVWSEPNETLLLKVTADGQQKVIHCRSLAALRPEDAVDEAGAAFVRSINTLKMFLMSTDAWKALPPYERLYE